MRWGEVAAYVLLAYGIYIMLGGLALAAITRRKVAVHPDAVARRLLGDRFDAGRGARLLWVASGITRGRQLGSPWILAAVADDVMVLEGQVPFVGRRTRVVVAKEDLRVRHGQVTVDGAAWKIMSTPAEALVSILVAQRWRVS